jgi:hypothetical protein
VCGPKIGNKWATQIVDTLREHRDTIYTPELVPYGLDGGHACMVTLTLQHSVGSALLFLLGVIMYAWSKVTTGGGYARDAERFGIVGWIRSLEITWSRRNWFHPHLHAIVLLSGPLSLEMAWELGWRLFGRWEAAVQRKGARVLAEYGLDVRLCNLDDMSSGALGDYLTKVSYEAAGEHFKTGRVADSFTMLGLVQEVIDTYEVQAFTAWRELEGTLAGKARRFVDFSKGARELRDRVGHREMSEQAMAEEDHHGDDVLAIDRAAWPTVAVQLEQLLTVTEMQGLDAAKAWLTARGVGWRDLTPVPRRRLVGRSAQAPRPPERIGRRLSPEEWEERRARWEARVDREIAAHRARRASLPAEGLWRVMGRRERRPPERAQRTAARGGGRRPFGGLGDPPASGYGLGHC